MASLSQQDTIAAIATAPGKGGVGIIRVSGENLQPFVKSISKIEEIKARYAYFASFYNNHDEIIDTGILLYFKSPNSFTGDDVVEIQAHGGMVVLQLLLKRCMQLGARLALPGEFTKRAFLNDKIDLIQAESIADLIEANSESAARMATRSLQGQFSHYIEDLKQEIINIRTLVEGSIDFPEEDIDFLNEAKIETRLINIQNNLDKILITAQQGSILREGVTLVLVGAPNAGKSSLLNVLAENEIAIVTDIAGTTRDVIKEEIILEGITIHLMDTAGLRETDDIIENIGIKKSHHSLNLADVTLIIIDPREGINHKTQQILDQLPKQLKKIYVHNKIDLINESPKITYINDKDPLINISAKKNLGIDLLKKEILQQIGYMGEDNSLFLARTRHVEALKQVQQEVEFAIENYFYLDLLAEHLKNAQSHLNEITGEYTSDDLLGNIFSQFCIGK
ncbi:tRNA uridine-5-carboxymethylaminomethyl(34) synthesis GTPase MnmE [Neisseriaceae bacterium PsAf]|nr:tRNA uridine-5-carboxymethylaminomethyl(34) synthesis GTPase MnmE [Neisseriaceae bacterium PsAf]MCV2502858.1 tRNA uridine-5-carboxymethylaminomethyl(34) synthesis GTPase MnmE [Neisseriaceae bacterium]